MKKIEKKDIPNLLFLLAVAGGLTLCLAKAVLFPIDINAYENRYAEKLAFPTLSGFADQSFQDGMEDALSDQVLYAQSAKKQYNEWNTGYLRSVLLPLSAEQEDHYFSYKHLYILGGDQLLYAPMELEPLQEQLDAKAENYNQIFEAFPQLDFYAYYIEKDTDINFETGEQSGIGAYALGQLELPEAHKAIYRTEDYASFREHFYKTDHHWSYKGSYQAYLELRELLGIEEAALEPQETVTVSHDFSGSKNSEAGARLFSEDFIAYRFDYPEMNITVNGSPAADYGSQEAYLSGQALDVKYGTFYGGDDGEIIFDTGRTDRENILIIGESYDNAVLKLLASHYGRTYSVDLRYYSHYFNQEFDLSAYVEANDIDGVLLIGNVDFYTMEEFMLEE